METTSILKPKRSPGAKIAQLIQGTWRLEIPSGSGDRYRLAQLDDYTGLSRRAFPWKPPLTLELSACASKEVIPGTWGFGLWNDPFSFSLGFGGGTRRVPALPNAAWFFFASPPNHLSLWDNLPAVGNLAATFQSDRLPTPVLALGALTLPLFAIPPLARLFRRLGRRYVRQDAACLPLKVCEWHTYHLDWEVDRVLFHVDGDTVHTAEITPHGPLGLVLWIDNQYASLPPNGRLGYGALPNPESAWIHIKNLKVNREELNINV